MSSTLLTSGATAQGAGIARSSALDAAMMRLRDGQPLPEPTPRMLDDAARRAVIEHIIADRQALTAWLVRRAGQAGGGVNGVLKILKDTSTFRARTRFDDEAAMAATVASIRAQLASGGPLVLALPLGGGKVGNPVKTGWRYLPDAAEWVAWSILGAIADAIAALHPPGARVLLIPDAPLHTADLGFAAADTRLHWQQAQEDLLELGVDHAVILPDVLAHLPAQWVAEVRRRADEARARRAEDAEFAASVAEQVRSLLFSVNLRAGAPSMTEAVMVNAVLAGHPLALPLPWDRHYPGVAEPWRTRAHALRELIEANVAHYVAVNHALRTLALPARIAEAYTGSPLHVRLTVHAKAGEPQPNLVPPGSRARPGLLPMHGVGLRYVENGKLRIATAFELEALMAGAEPVLDRSGRFLFHALPGQ